MEGPISLLLPHILQGNPDIFMKKNLHPSSSHFGEEPCKCVQQYHMYYNILSKYYLASFPGGVVSSARNERKTKHITLRAHSSSNYKNLES